MPVRTRVAVLAAITLLAASAVPTFAADNGTVDATVTVASPCVLVSPGSVDFGTLAFSQTGALVFSGKTISITSCGSSSEKLYGRATDAYVGDLKVWSLVYDHTPCIYGPNEFNLVFAGGPGVSAYAQTTDQLLETIPGNGTAATAGLNLAMPCVGSDGIGDTVSFQAVFTATF